jgi:RNA polymerase sigma factor (sigma-70 family)
MKSLVPIKPEKDPNRVEFYEGLVKSTASKYHAKVQEEYEDMCQTLRLKVMEALAGYDPKRARQPIEGYVFQCVVNKVKDYCKRRRRDDLYMEDVATSWSGSADGARQEITTDRFEAQYFLEQEADAFGDILRQTPLLPAELTDVEERVLLGLYIECQQKEIAVRFDLTPREVAKAVKAIKVKMADWKPS